MTPRSAKEARELGVKRYFTGKPCSKGHVDWRQVSSNGCMACQREATSRYVSRNLETVRTKRRAAVDSNREEWRARWRARRAKNPELARQYCKSWREQNREASRAASARWIANNREYQLEACRKWNRENRERLAAWKREQYRVNPDKINAYIMRRKARKAQAEGFYTDEDVRRLRGTQRGRCACCKKKVKLCVDHIVPLAKGGSNRPSNLQLLCRPCNSSKHTRDAVEFMRSRGFLL